MWMYRHVADEFALYRCSGFASRELFVRRSIIRTCCCKEGSVRDQALAPAGTTRPPKGRDVAVVADDPSAGTSMHLASIPLMVRLLARCADPFVRQKIGHRQQLRIHWSTSPLLPKDTLHNCWRSFVLAYSVVPTQDVFNEDFLFSSS
jgi:hypothetical protein